MSGQEPLVVNPVSISLHAVLGWETAMVLNPPELSGIGEANPDDCTHFLEVFAGRVGSIFVSCGEEKIYMYIYVFKYICKT